MWRQLGQREKHRAAVYLARWCTARACCAAPEHRWWGRCRVGLKADGSRGAVLGVCPWGSSLLAPVFCVGVCALCVVCSTKSSQVRPAHRLCDVLAALDKHRPRGAERPSAPLAAAKLGRPWSQPWCAIFIASFVGSATCCIEYGCCHFELATLSQHVSCVTCSNSRPALLPSASLCAHALSY